MRRLLIVSPHFPPINAPDMQRVRMSLPHYAAHGWQPTVLAVDPARVEGVHEPRLLETVPATVEVHRAGAFDTGWTRRVGIGALGLRAFPHLYAAGARLIEESRPDLVFFSTTMFPCVPLGRLWKSRFGVPFVVDMQDPWVGDYYETRARAERPPKYALAQRMHRVLEPFAMQAVDGIIAVTSAYHETLRRRYPWIREDLCRTIPFGASQADVDVAARMPFSNPFFRRDDGLIHGTYVGVLGRAFNETCRAICLAFRRGLDTMPELFGRVRLHFIGTDYASADRARPTIRPHADAAGVGEYVREQTSRIPYFEALRVLQDAAFLIVPGTDNAQYTASKIYPYILARRPLLAVFHNDSSVVSVLERTRAGSLVGFGEGATATGVADALLPAWRELLERLPFTPATDWQYFARFLAPEMTRQQCELFDSVIAQRSAVA